MPLIKAVGQSGAAVRRFSLQGPFPVDRQKELSAYVMDVMGIDKISACFGNRYPFTTREFSKNDVRITTKYIEEDLTSNSVQCSRRRTPYMNWSVDDALIPPRLSGTRSHYGYSRIPVETLGEQYRQEFFVLPAYLS